MVHWPELIEHDDFAAILRKLVGSASTLLAVTTAHFDVRFVVLWLSVLLHPCIVFAVRY